METVASLVEKVETFSIREKGKTINRHFEENVSAQGAVIIDDSQKPVGLIMRTHFYQMIGTQFGFNIYMNRDVELLMKKEILCLDMNHEIADFGYKAMGRGSDDVFDFVIILKEDRYYGVVSISNFLAAMSNIKQREIELLNEQQKILEEAHEKEKSYRKEIEQKNRAIKNLMDNADQGFLSFGEDMVISGEYSHECEKIYGKDIHDANFLDLMQDFLPEDKHQLLSETLDSLFALNKKSRAKIYLKLLPDHFTVNERFIQIRYKIISFKKNKTMMVILTDITDKKALEQKSIDEKNNMKLVLSAINSKAEILDAIDEARRFFNEEAKKLLSEPSELSQKTALMFRLIHTMKGDFALRSLHNTAIRLHHLEDQLSELLHDDQASLEALEALIIAVDIEAILEKDLRIIKDFLGESFMASDKHITVSHERLEVLIKMVEDRFHGDDYLFLEQSIRKLTYPTIQSVFAGYSEYIQILALKLNKSVSDFRITGDELYLNPASYTKFLKSLIHLFRNIVDHGIELPEDRIEKGKPEQGLITCHIIKDESAMDFTLTISDDGKGIDPDIIAKKAIEKGTHSADAIATMSEEDILNIIFQDAFSTKDNVSMLSGRGVGLAAVKEETKAIQGNIRVSSKPGEGTTFTIHAPFDL